MNLTKYGNLQNGGDGYSFDVSHNIAGNPQVNSYTQCSRVGGNSPLEQPPVPIKQESVYPKLEEMLILLIIRPKIGNLPEVTRIEQCGDHVKQDAPFMVWLVETLILSIIRNQNWKFTRSNQN